MGINDEIRNKILKYYFLTSMNRGDQQQLGDNAAPLIGTMVHSPVNAAPVPNFPLREAEIRRLITRFTGHPIEVLLRRALRASRNGE
jgi:hypothetical protein